MTNKEIIANEAILNGIYTEEELEQIAVTGDLGLHTYGEWLKMGYHVRKGEKARIKTKLWKKVMKKARDKDTGEEKKEKKFYLCTAYLFAINQVEKTN